VRFHRQHFSPDAGAIAAISNGRWFRQMQFLTAADSINRIFHLTQFPSLQFPTDAGSTCRSFQ
jgi:hypothetical protein